MSRIIYSLKCKYCEAEVKNIYISFGHPNTDFIWEWKCKECGKINEELIEKLPLMHDQIEEMFNDYCRKHNLTPDDVAQILKNKA